MNVFSGGLGPIHHDIQGQKETTQRIKEPSVCESTHCLVLAAVSTGVKSEEESYELTQGKDDTEDVENDIGHGVLC